jgi:D-alanyl-D-alanine carboxypeptidase (penicillin-binding protein 5/6)
MAVAAFVDLMNQKAAELGCENTWFITPNGLDGEELVENENGESVTRYHETTAAELAKIMTYCISDSSQSDQFLEITQTPSYTFQSGNGRSFACYNHNAFLNMMPGVISGKTGFTTKAGYCYVGALEENGRKYVVALLACGWPNNKTYKWADTRKLMEYGIENYFYRTFLDLDPDPKWLEKIPVVDGQKENLDEQAFVEVKIQEKDPDEKEREGLLMKAGEQVEVTYSVEKVLTAPVEAGMEIGQIKYIVDGQIYYIEEIVTSHGVEKIDWQWCLEQMLDRFLVFG